MPETNPVKRSAKKKKGRWTRDTDLGRYKLASCCRVPTSYIQSMDGTTRSGENKGKAAKHAGETFPVDTAIVKAILIAIAMYDDGKQNVFPRNGWVAERTGLGDSSLANGIRALTQAGFLRKTGRGFKKSKNWWLNWDVILAGQFESGDYSGEEKTEPIQTKPAKPTKFDPVVEDLVNLVMARVSKLGPIGEALTRQATGPVIGPLCKRHEEKVIEDAITTLKDFQWRLVVQADSPAAYLTKTLKNTIAGITPHEAWGIAEPETKAAADPDEESETEEHPPEENDDEEPPEEEEPEQIEQDEEGQW
jgi:hypothetical protein